MKYMKKMFTAVAVFCLFMVFVTGCTPESPPLDPPTLTPTGEAVTETVKPTETPTEAVTPTTSPTEAPQGKTVVIVFSQTGNTKRVAQVIADALGAELYVIEAEVPYTTEDLNWNDKNSRTTIEQNDNSARPAIGSAKIDLTGCTRVFLGYPIWFAKEPRIMDTFVESYDFTGITVIPFCTSGSSPIRTSRNNLQKLAGTGDWKDGQRFAATASDEEIKNWVESVK